MERETNRRRIGKFALGAAIAAAGIVLLLLVWGGRGGPPRLPGGGPDAERAGAAPRAPVRAMAGVSERTAPETAEDEEPKTAGELRATAESEKPKTAEELREAEEEARVEDFDAMTDAWMEPKGTVSMKDVDAFAKAFRSVPRKRQDECIHRALNLIPDENVLLLAGILMDKSFDREILELVFNDVLNRDESVKKPILRSVYEDKTHPCWADTAWIFDVTGETLKSGASDAHED